MATKLLPVMRRSQHEAEDAVETLLRQSFMKMKTKMNKMQETKVKGLELLGEEEYEWMMQALLFSILSDDPNSNSNSNSNSKSSASASASAMTHLKLIVVDGYSALVRIVRRVVEESFPKLLQQSKQQLIWLFRHLVQLSANECEILTISLLRRIQGGADMSHANLWLALELLYVLQTNSAWLMRNTNGVLVASVFCYLRLLSDHCRICPGGNSSSSRILGILKKSEVEFCARVLRECLRECLGIGRDLLRLLRDVVGFVPEVESVWNDLVGNPASFRVLGFSDVSQIYWSRTSSRFSVYRISPEMEIQLRFLLTHVRWGSQRRYLTWFGAKFLATPESETLIPDVIRFICCAHHPSNEILQSDVIARWAVIGWLLKCCRSPQVHYNASLALFYDWLFFNDKTDNVMNIEPAILLMLHSLPKYADITVSLLEFLLAAVDNYVSHKKALVQRSVCAAFHVLLNKGVVVSLEPLLLSHLICPALRNKLSVLLSLEQANHSAATKLNNVNDPILNSPANNNNNHNNKRPFSDNTGIENDGDSPKPKLGRMEERVLLSDSAFPLMPPSLVSKPSSVNVVQEEEKTVDVDAINEKNKGVEQPQVLISDIDPRLMSTSLVSTHVSEHVAIENDVDVTEQEKVPVNDSHIFLPGYSSPLMPGSLGTTPVSGCATVACNTDAVNLKTSSAEEPQVLVPTSASPLLAASVPANGIVESDSNSTKHKTQCVEEFEALELRIIIEALKGSRDMKLMALDRLEKFIMCSLGICNSTLGCPDHDDIFCTKEIKSRALQLANSLESGGQKMFLPLNCCTVSLEDDDEVVSATAAVLCMYTLFPHPNFQAMLVIWEKNGWAVGSRLLCYVCRLADELAELLALKDTTEKIEDSLTGLERQTADSYFDRCDAIQNLVLLKRHSYKHNKYTKPKGKQSNRTQYHKELDLNHLLALVEGAFKSYREFLNATAQGYAAPNVSEGNNKKTSTVEKSDAFSIFLDNLRTCCLWSIPRLFVSLKNIFQRLPDLSVGQKCVVELLVSFLVPSETLKFEKKLIMQEFSIFGKNPLVIRSLVKASLEWECTEQQLFWQLLVSDVHAHTVSVAHSLLSFCSRTLDPKQHGCAISGLLIFLRCQPPCIELAKAIVCVPIELADFAASVILSWCATNQSVLLKCLQDSVEFCSPKTGDISNGWDPSETMNVLSIRSIMSFLDKQIFSGRSNILEIKTCLSEFTNKIS